MPMSAFTDFAKGVGDIAGGLGGVGALVSGITGLFSDNSAKKQLKQQYEYQRKLAEQQQEYAEENAETAYMRQLEGTRLTPLLEKEGRVAAGVSSAYGSGGSSASLASVSQASPAGAGSIAAPPSDADVTSKYVQMLISGSSALSDLSLKREQRVSQEIGNALDLVTFNAMADKRKSEAKSAEAKANIDSIQSDIMDKYGMKNADSQSRSLEADAITDEAYAKYAQQMAYTDLLAKQASLANALADKDLKEQERKNAEHQYDLITQEIRQRQLQNIGLGIENAYKPAFLSSQIRSNNASAANSYAQAGKAQAETVGIDYDNTVKWIETQRKLKNKDVEDALYKKALNLKSYSIDQQREILKNEAIKSKLDTLSKSQHEELMRYLQDPKHADDSFIKRWPARLVATVFELLDSIGGVATAVVTKGAVGKSKKPTSQPTNGYTVTTGW